MKRSTFLTVVSAFLVLVLALGLIARRYEQRKNNTLPAAAPGLQNEPPQPGETGPASALPRLATQGAQPLPSNCPGVTCDSRYFSAWKIPAAGSCHTSLHKGYPEPDPHCTPGGVVPGITLATLKDPNWKTACIRNCQSTEAQKHAAYGWYGLPVPPNNTGATQVCELDHLVPLELGGADGMGNIWPQCGPDAATLNQRYFKQKDVVENYLATEVRAGRMPLATAQHRIASDWVQLLPTARAMCSGGRCGPERTEE